MPRCPGVVPSGSWFSCRSSAWISPACCRGVDARNRTRLRGPLTRRPVVNLEVRSASRKVRCLSGPLACAAAAHIIFPRGLSSWCMLVPRRVLTSGAPPSFIRKITAAIRRRRQIVWLDVVASPVAVAVRPCPTARPLSTVRRSSGGRTVVATRLRYG